MRSQYLNSVTTFGEFVFLRHWWSALKHATAKHKTALAVIRGTGVGVLFAATAGLAQNSADEDVSPNVSVSDRFARNFGADGVAAGGFTLLPSVSLAAIYDDNIFSVASPTDDFIADLRASLRLRSNWSTHGLELFGTARRLQFADNDGESTTDFLVGGNLTFDFSARSDVTLSASHREGIEARRTAQTAVGAADPVQFSSSLFAVDFDLRQNRFGQQFGASYRIDDYDDAMLLAGGGVIDQDFRDRNVFNVYGRQLYRVRPTVALFVGANAEWNDYESPQIGLGADQDSHGYGVNGGVAFDINKVARGEIGVGYEKRLYDSAVFADIEGLNVDASLEYFVTDLTTITIDADRSIRNTAVPGVAGFYSNSAGLKVEHELFRPILLVADVEYRQDDFRGIDREDKLFSASAGIDYAFRREVIFSLRYDYFDFKSDGLAARESFTENVIRLGVELRL